MTDSGSFGMRSFVSFFRFLISSCGTFWGKKENNIIIWWKFRENDFTEKIAAFETHTIGIEAAIVILASHCCGCNVRGFGWVNHLMSHQRDWWRWWKRWLVFFFENTDGEKKETSLKIDYLFFCKSNYSIKVNWLRHCCYYFIVVLVDL